MSVTLILNLIAACCVCLAVYIMFYIKRSETESILEKVNDLPIPILIIDYATNNIVKSNDLLFQLINHLDINGKSISTLNIFQDFNVYLEIKGSAESNVTKYMKLALNTKDGQIIVKASYSLLTIGLNKYIIISMLNKTDLTEYLKNLGIFVSLIDKSNDGIIISKYKNTSQEQPTIMYANNAVESITGFNPNELKNNNLLDIMFNNRIDEITFEDLKDKIKKSRKCSIECQYNKKNGESCWISVEVVPIVKSDIIHSLSELDETHSITEIMALELYDIDLYIVIKQTDITAFKQMESYAKIFDEKLNYAISEKNKTNEALICGFVDLMKLSAQHNAVEYCLEMLGRALSAETVFVAKLFNDDNDMHYIRYTTTWPSEASNVISADDVKIFFNTDIDGYELYANLISNKITKIYSDSVKSVETKMVFDKYGIKSALISPIYKDNSLIGFVGVCETEDVSKIWDDAAENMISIVANGLRDFI